MEYKVTLISLQGRPKQQRKFVLLLEITFHIISVQFNSSILIKLIGNFNNIYL
jgi:hypothetical protein